MLRNIAIGVFCLMLSGYVVAQSTNTAAGNYDAGMKCKDQKKYAEALDLFKKTIEKAPGYKDAVYMAGWCCNEMGKHEEALPLLLKATRLMPGEAKVYLEIGYANQKLKHNKEAKENYNKCISLNSKTALAYKYLGDLFFDESEYETALLHYENYFKNETNITGSQVYYRKGYCENDQERYNAAVESLSKAVKKDPDYTDAYNELGYACTKLGKKDDAIKYFNEALRIDPKSYVACNGLGDIYRTVIKDNSEAMKYYFKTLAVNPENKKANYSIGWCYNDQGKYNDAVTYLKKALETDNNYVNALTELGYSDYALQNYDDALPQFNKALSIKKTGLSLYYAGLCYVGLKQKANAQRMYEELKEMNSTDAEKLKKKIDGM